MESRTIGFCSVSIPSDEYYQIISAVLELTFKWDGADNKHKLNQ